MLPVAPLITGHSSRAVCSGFFTAKGLYGDSFCTFLAFQSYCDIVVKLLSPEIIYLWRHFLWITACFSLGKFTSRDIYFKMLSKNLHPRPFNVPNGNGTLVGIFRSPHLFCFGNTPTTFPLGPRNVGNIESLKYVCTCTYRFLKNWDKTCIYYTSDCLSANLHTNYIPK